MRDPGTGGDGWSRHLRSSVAGVLIGGLGFLALGLYLNVATDYPPLSNPGPVAILGLIGATVGGLVGPLLAGLMSRWRPGGD